MKKSVSIVIGFFLLVSFVLAGCSSESSSGDTEKVTLNLSLWDENVSDVIDKSIADFEEANPNVDVKVTYTPWADYWTKLKTSLAGGSGPDVFWMNGGYLHQYISSDLVKNLQPFIEEENFDTSVYTPSLVELYSSEGDLYGLPYFLDVIALFYNKKLFDEAGIPYPDDTWTWETIEEVGGKLTNKEEGIYGYIAQIKRQEGYYNYIHQAGGYVISDDKKSSGFNTPESISAFKWMQSLMDQGISPSAQTQMENTPDQIFGSGKAAMVPLISVNAASQYEMLGEDLGIAPLPAGENKASLVHGISWAINNNTKEDKLAWELVKTLSGKEGGEYIAESGFSIPAYTGTESKWVESIPSVDLQVFIDSLEFGVPAPVSKKTAEWSDVATKEIQDAFLGKQSIEDAMKKISDKMDEVLASE